MERLRSKDAEAVRRELERFDAASARALRASFNVEQEDALLYHIVLNTDRLPVEACVNAVCQLAEHPRFRDPATTRTELADKLTTYPLLHSCDWAPGGRWIACAMGNPIGDRPGVTFGNIAPSGVTVSAVNGRITLAGTSSSGALRRRAEQVAHQVAGVRQIDNRIISVPTRGGAFSAQAPRRGTPAPQAR